jgi:hypothetical protein
MKTFLIVLLALITVMYFPLSWILFALLIVIFINATK